MKGWIRTGAALLVTLALLAGMLPAALAQEAETQVNTQTEPERETAAAAPGEPEETGTPDGGSADETPDGPSSETPDGAIAEEQPPQEEPELTQIGAFSEGMIRVTDGSRWGYADPYGTIVIDLRFEAAEDFELGVTRVKVDGKVGLLHWDGTYLFEPVYDELVKVGYGLYLGRVGAAWDLLSEAENSAGDRVLYSGLTAARVSSGVNGQLILQEQSGKTVRVYLRNLPDWLRSKKVGGWQFPLYNDARASFTDVSGQDWYDRWVNLVYSTGMMEGTGEGKFDPEKELTVAETLRLAACLESRAIQDDFHLQSVSGAQWYSTSVAYCEAVGIIAYGEFARDDLNRPVTRAEMARILSRTTAVRGMENRNDPTRVRGFVPDVQSGDYAADAIFGMYAKGIFNGKDSLGSFHPDEYLTRAEAAAVIARIARPEHRITLWE